MNGHTATPFLTLERRISLFLCLPLATIDKLAIKNEIDRNRASMKFNLRARLTAEFVGSAFLVAAVVGSGIMGERLAGGNVAIALLANTIATGAALVALILTFGPISGAHLNPAVTLADAIEHGIMWPEALAYMVAQCAGAITGAIVAHLMFGLRWYSFSTHPRHGWSSVLSEFCVFFRTAIGYLGMFAAALGSRAIRCCQLHHRGVLVHCFYLVCKPSSDNRPVLIGHFRGDSTR